MKSTRHTPIGRRIRTSLGLAEAAPAAATGRCVSCLEPDCQLECGRCTDCFRARRDQVMQLQALVHIDPKLSAADLMHRTGASGPVVTAFLRSGADAALLARESLRACTGSPMQARDIVHAHNARAAAEAAGSRFAVH